MSEVKTEPTVLDKLRSQRTAKVDGWAEFISTRDGERSQFEERSGSDEFKALDAEARDAEVEAFKNAEATFKAESDQRKAAIEDLDERISDKEDIQRRKDEAARASKGHVEVGSEPMTYRADNGRGQDGLSYYRDLALVHGPGITLQSGGNRDQAQARLIRHANEMDIEMPKRAAAREKRALAQVAEAEIEFLTRNRHRGTERVLEEMRNSGGLTFNPFEQRVTPNSAQGTGGYFIPPTWLVDDYIPGLRAHRVVANLPRRMDIPSGTNSINIPKLSTLTVVGYQQMNNSGLPSQDWTDTSVQANVKTVGGYSDVAIQLLEQSPHGIVDEVITTDLLAAHDKFMDAEVIAGDGSNAASLNGGHLLGLYPSTNWSGTNSVTYTDASPTGQHFVSVFGAMASQVSRNRFDIQNYATVLHGRRWFAYSCSLDANGRPLGETANGGRFNVAAALESGLRPEGLVGTLPFLSDTPVYVDDNIPTNDNTDGGGATRDIAISGNWDDAWLFEDALRTDVFREVLSGSLGVRFRVYNYAALLVRYGQSFAVATGSGFAAPTGTFSGSVSSLTF